MTGHEGSSYVDIIFKARHAEVLERFETHATAKLVKIEQGSTAKPSGSTLR